MMERSILKLCIGLTSLALILTAFGSKESLKTAYTIEKSNGGSWTTSETNLPDTLIVDTVNVDGIVTYNRTRYLRVLKK